MTRNAQRLEQVLILLNAGLITNEQAAVMVQDFRAMMSSSKWGIK